MTDDLRDKFTQRYQEKSTPWDTNITPPEIVAITEELPPGKALDLGCGTGTNVGYMLKHGWQADGVEFVQQAVDMANQKLSEFPPESFGVYCHDVTQLESCAGLRPPYDLVIDIGCGHGLLADLALKYARDIAAFMAPGGTFMLFAHEPTEERPHFGWKREDVSRIFSPYFDIVWQEHNDDTTTGMPSGWYRLQKSAD